MSDELKSTVDGSPEGYHNSSTFAELAHQSRSQDTRSTVMSHHPTDTRRSPRLHNQEAMRGSVRSLQAVFDTPELLIMILSHLSTRDLTRCLTVSNHWRDMILDPRSKELRRILFLEPAQKAKHHLEYTNADPRYYQDNFSPRHQPTIVREPNQNSRPILEVHPVLLPGSNLACKTFVRTGFAHLRLIQSVPPEAYLFQPPVEEVKIICRSSRCRIKHSCRRRIRCAGGVTFGALFAGLDKRLKRAEVYIEAEKAVLMAAMSVKIARMAHVLKELYERNALQVQRGLPAVPESEFERLRELGSRIGWEATWSFLESNWRNAG